MNFYLSKSSFRPHHIFISASRSTPFKHSSHFLSVLAVILTLGFSYNAKAQSYPVLPSPNYDVAHTASATGTVKQSDGAGIAGVLVKLKRADGTVVSNVLTDVNGNYTLTAKAAADTYTIEIEYPTDGFSISTSPAAFPLSGSDAVTGKDFLLARNPNTLTVCDVHTVAPTPWGTNPSSPEYLNLTKPTNSNAYTSVKLFTSATTQHPELYVANANTNAESRVTRLEVGAVVYHEAPAISTSVNSFMEFAKNNIGGSQNLVVPAGGDLTYYDISSGKTETSGNLSSSSYATNGGNLQIQIAATAEITSAISGGNTSFSVTTNANAGACLVYTYAANPLPVKLVTFTAVKLKGEPVSLNWETTEEQDAERFEVQRSTDAATWSSVGSVEAQNKGTYNSKYSFSDAGVVNAINYYRLKMIDLDGKFEFSQIRSVNLGDASQNLAVFPNPFPSTGGTLSLANATEIKEIEIVNMTGKSVLREASPVKNGALQINSLSKGLYVVKMVTQTGETKVSRLLVD